jgi:hypothetical protein
MATDELASAEARYTAAYEAYQQAAKRVAVALAGGLSPSAEEIESEKTAIEDLGVARGELLDVMRRLLPPH